MGRRIGRLAGCVILVLLLCIPQNWGILTAVKAENQIPACSKIEAGQVIENRTYEVKKETE